ncbi:MAG TPA: DUF1178 family protein [Usitatibacter sp.]|nr:DUF1178 family protein [Usitatibacter sp.]
MIVYPLTCSAGHFFEGWFASAQACEKQSAAGQLSCPACASVEVRRLPSAPYVKASPSSPPEAGAAPKPGEARARALAALRKYILANTEDVGRRFPEVARRIHYGEEEARGIRGRASVQEARELVEEGVSVAAVSPEVLPAEEIH